MANVRIAQIGQTAALRPIYEVMVDTRRYCFAVGANGRATFKPRSWLFSLGLCSVVCDTYGDSIAVNDAATLKLDNNQSVERGSMFTAQTYGSGFAFVPEYSVFTGWAKIIPTGFQNFIL